MIYKVLLSISFIVMTLTLSAQTKEELKAEKAEKLATISTLKGEIAAIDSKLATIPGWRFGSFGTIGVNFSQFNDWFSNENPNTYSSTIGFSGNAFANLIQEKYFWRNSGNLNIAKTKLAINQTERDTGEYKTSADVINMVSLYGYKLSEKVAISTLGEYRSTILNNFNNPGYLDIGVGATITPIENLVVVIHPLNYNFVFSSGDFEYESSLGAKLVADYTRSLPSGISWKSNLSSFISYKDVPNLSNWTWVNGFGLTIWKGIGVGFELGLRKNKQEALSVGKAEAMAAGNDPATVTFDNVDNPLQTYWLLGLTYSL